MSTTTLLHSWHKTHGAQWTTFADYELPLSYESGALEEHLLCRNSAALFDIDHMGQFEVRGPGADAFASKIATAALHELTDYSARYSLILNSEGGVVDDVIVYRIPEGWFFVVNASNRASDFAWFKDHLTPQTELVDRSDELYMMAIQGPEAIGILDAVCSTPISSIPRMGSIRIEIGKAKVFVGRTGYTGEDGAELFVPPASAIEVWTTLIDAAEELGVRIGPAGLAARDSLRFEAGMALYGHEISADINPIEAGLKWTCDFSKEFIGRAAVERVINEGPSRRLVTVDVDQGIPREGVELTDSNHRIVGRCVCGMYCPTVRLFAANALVRPEHAKVGQELEAIIRQKPRRALVVKRPLYKVLQKEIKPAQ